jgi:hypothetical protein
MTRTLSETYASPNDDEVVTLRLRGTALEWEREGQKFHQDFAHGVLSIEAYEALSESLFSEGFRLRPDAPMSELAQSRAATALQTLHQLAERYENSTRESRLETGTRWREALERLSDEVLPPIPLPSLQEWCDIRFRHGRVHSLTLWCDCDIPDEVDEQIGDTRVNSDRIWAFCLRFLLRHESFATLESLDLWRARDRPITALTRVGPLPKIRYLTLPEEALEFTGLASQFPELVSLYCTTSSLFHSRGTTWPTLRDLTLVGSQPTYELLECLPRIAPGLTRLKLDSLENPLEATRALTTLPLIRSLHTLDFSNINGKNEEIVRCVANSPELRAIPRIVIHPHAVWSGVAELLNDWENVIWT